MIETVFESIFTWLQKDSSIGNFKREIGSNFDLWCNGYLGPFFRFKVLGWLNWLVFPLIGYFLITIKSKKRWEIALFLALMVSIIFICLQGYANSRYQLTLFPVITPLIFLYGYDILKTKKRLFMVMTLLCVCLILGNIYISCQKYCYYYNSAKGSGVPGTRFPDKLIRYLNEKVDQNAVVESKNQPILYYYTDKKSRPDRAPVKDYYVLLRGDSLNGGRRFELLMEDQGYKLYKKISPVHIRKKLEQLREKKPKFELNIGKLPVFNKTSLNKIKEYIPSLEILGKRNDYNFQSHFEKDIMSIRISLSNREFNVKPILQLGIKSNRTSSILNIRDNDMLYLIVRMRQSKLKGGSTKIFIQDQTAYWARETSEYKGDKWSDIFVKKRIREGFKKISLGIYWEPLNDKEWIELSLIQVFVERNQS
ncbi:hypothetical protein [uncultured Desulfobacter sp.]|uniref:hypothetical protein n=1 Tax=uncultured Desulfobacter sp. TaxID=240139 RepID=UPI002AA8E91F|nr:hypothetical protein [uncultured Desulfobacter sp.]